MQRIRHTTAAAVRPDYSSTGEPGFFREGAPGGDPPTHVSADWLNGMQEEPAAVIEAAGLELDEADNTQLLQALHILIDAKLAALAVFPVGAIMMRAVNNAPAGWLMCDGAELGRAAYPALFAAIGEAFGGGDGSTTFNVPDLRDRFPRCHDARTERPFGSTQADATKLPALSATIEQSGAYSGVLTSTSAALGHYGANTDAAGAVGAQTLTAQSTTHGHLVSTDSVESQTSGRTVGHTHNLYCQYTTVKYDAQAPNSVNVVQFIGNGIQPGQPYYGGGHTQGETVDHKHWAGIAQGGAHTHPVSVPAIPAHTHFVAIPAHDPHSHQTAVDIPPHTHSITVTGNSAAETRPKNITLAFMIRAI
ncbi:tail fiber protein [Methylolobus aquaticus]